MKTSIIKLRVDTNDKQRIESEALNAGMSVSAFIRNKLLATFEQPNAEASNAQQPAKTDALQFHPPSIPRCQQCARRARVGQPVKENCPDCKAMQT